MEGMGPKASLEKQHLEPTWREILFGGGETWYLGRRPFGSQLIREAVLPGGECKGQRSLVEALGRRLASCSN